MPNRKTVTIDVLRQVLGERQTDDILEKLAPAKPTIPVDVRSLSLARTLYADPMTESNQWGDTLQVIRRYFLERGQSRRAFLGWLDEASAGAIDGAPRDARQRPRRKITDPEVLERRPAALAKARAARSRRRQGAHQG